MEKLTVMISSFNNAEKSLELVYDVYGIADEILILDSGSAAQRKAMELRVRKEKLKKVRVLYALDLGYPDPLRMYALKHCKCNWIFLIDPDERLSEKLKGVVKELITNTKASAFAIRRYENVAGKQLGSFWTWQVRLFKKRNTRYNGMVHEQPAIDGKTETLNDGAMYMLHFEHRYQEHEPAQYYKLHSIFDRMSYKAYNERFLDYLSKLTPSKSIGSSFVEKSASMFLKSYQRLRSKKPDEEVTTLDYLWFYMFLDFGYLMKKRDLIGMLNVLPTRLRYVTKRKKDLIGEEAKELFEISKIINSIGIIKFLHLDDVKVVDSLTKKYVGKPQGGDLLIKLLKESYEKRGQ